MCINAGTDPFHVTALSLSASTCNFTKINTPPWSFPMFSGGIEETIGMKWINVKQWRHKMTWMITKDQAENHETWNTPNNGD